MRRESICGDYIYKYVARIDTILILFKRIISEIMDSYIFLRMPEVPPAQPKPGVTAPPEVAPAPKSWASNKQGGQGDGKWT